MKRSRSGRVLYVHAMEIISRGDADHPQLHPFCSFFELLALAFLVEVDLEVWCDPRDSRRSLSAGPVCWRFVLLGKAWSWWAIVEATEA